MECRTSVKGLIKIEMEKIVAYVSVRDNNIETCRMLLPENSEGLIYTNFAHSVIDKCLNDLHLVKYSYFGWFTSYAAQINVNF